MTSSGRWALALVAVTAAWGWSFVGVHDVLRQIAPSAFVAFRFALAAVFLALFCPIRGITRREALAGLVCGVFLFAGFALQTIGLLTATPSNSGFITGMTVVFTPLLGFLAMGRRLAWPQALALLVAVVGLGLLTVRDVRVAAGDVWTLGSAVAFAMNILAVDKANRWGSPARITVAQLAAVALFGGIWSICAGDGLAPPSTTRDWAALLAIAVTGTAVAYFVQAKALTVMPPSRVALIFTSEPLFAAVFGVWLAGDRFTAVQLLGGALVVAAMLASEFGDRRRGPAATESRSWSRDGRRVAWKRFRGPG
ncbi:protein of unknown function DUF6 transmembrane [Segniliparus rotundus DSM 44985]|uniref:EamA domain-containing protein n=1 Tax=Segniliparus rotundus (strain ATCC BAA-972 / CDC 1076 / CIP 108378 / DSM 44985 / JCM 13578) TaxID=640132 RepID=D6Z7T9_SEGRD|nr:EamA family transporter [Segniliparus rotundus]ADG98019.1 protein of unknown function DUF6 transmembrane [Segniliparus rotundus DSM 44985]